MTDKDNAPERIWIIPYSVDEWYYESDMYTGSIEYILTSVTDERMRELRDNAKRLFKDNIKMRDELQKAKVVIFELRELAHDLEERLNE